MKNNWPTKKLGEVAEFINGFGFKSNSWSTGGLPIIRIQNLNDLNKEFNHFDGQVDDKYHVNNGDVLVSWSGSIGVYKWKSGPALLNQHIFKVGQVRNEVGIEYLFLVLQTKIDEIKTKLHGGTMKHITKNLFDKISINLPPKEEQQNIVERLDAIRKSQELCDTQIQKTEELFESILSRIFSNKKRTMVNLGSTCDFENGDRGKNYPSKFLTTEGIPFISASNIQDGKIFFDERNFIPRDKYDLLNAGKIKKNDILFCLRGSVGKVYFIEDLEEGAIASSLVIIRAKNSVIARYIFYILKSNLTTNSIERYRNGAVVGNLSASDLKKFLIPALSLQEQHKIVEKLDAILDYKKLLLKQKSLLKELFDSVLYKSMNGEMGS